MTTNTPKETQFTVYCTKCGISDGPLTRKEANSTLENHLTQMHSTQQTELKAKNIAGIQVRG